MAHDAIPLQSKSLGNKATEGHMPPIFAILLQDFVHGRIFINAISSTVNPDFAAGDDHEDEFCSFFSHKLHKSNMLILLDADNYLYLCSRRLLLLLLMLCPRQLLPFY